MSDTGKKHTPRIGIALGSGSARGWSHIGVLEALAERGIRPQVVAGASIGSLVGGAYASGQLDELKDWALSLGRMDVLRLLDARLRGGLMQGGRVMGAIGELLSDHEIESLPVAFGAVATDLSTGREVWMREGSLMQAVRASSGLPGLFSPLRVDGRWLVDGGLVNPVPVSLCHALGADIVIAVNLNASIVARRQLASGAEIAPAEEESSQAQSQFERLAQRVSGWFSQGNDVDAPGILDVIGASVNIMQDRITRSRMAGEPPEIVLTPRMADYQLMDFHRAEEAIEAGRTAVRRAGPGLDVLPHTRV